LKTKLTPPTETSVQFTRPVSQILSMLIVIGLFGAGAWLAFGSLRDVFLTSPWLNGVIGFVFLLGVIACFWQILQLFYSVRWLEDFLANGQGRGADHTTAPRLLAPLAALLRSRGVESELSSGSTRSILDSLATRIDEVRDITRYLTNLLIFLGLLGTFYGLATTIPGVVDTIRALSPKEGETAVQVFQKLMSGLESQLGGMGVAFSSSLVGLAGSLVVGLLELFVSHGQNRFYRELEEWLSSITRIGLAGSETDGDSSALVGLLDQIVRRMEQTEQRASQDRAAMAAGLQAMAEGFKEMAAVGNSDPALEQIARSQARMLEIMETEGGLGADAEARMRLRSIDVQLLRVLEEMSAGRQESVADLRADLTALTAAVRQFARASGH